MRPGMNSAPRRRRIAQRYRHQYPRIVLGVFRRGEPLDWSKFRGRMTWDFKTDYEVGKVRDIECDRRGIWSFRPYIRRVAETWPIAKMFRSGLIGAGMGGFRGRNGTQVVTISLFPKKSEPK